jgi:UDP-perosamine 4-acetyltransferase
MQGTAEKVNNMSLIPLILIGAGGHAGVVIDIINQLRQYKVVGCTDFTKNNHLGRYGVTYLGKDDVLFDLQKKGINHAALGVAGFNNEFRKNLYTKILGLGFQFPVLQHPNSTVAKNVEIGQGSVIMANAVINPGVKIEENVIINTGTVIEHDCYLSHSAQIGPGAILCGDVKIGKRAFVGAGACIIQGIRIGEAAIVGAGSVVINDVLPGTTVVGNPAHHNNTRSK